MPEESFQKNIEKNFEKLLNSWAGKYIAKIPGLSSVIQKQIDKEFAPKIVQMEKDTFAKRTFVTDTIPNKGWTNEQILTVTRNSSKNAGDGKKMSGAIYPDTLDEYAALAAEIDKDANYTNPLHEEAWPQLAQREAEAISMVAKLFNGDDDISGSITYGGTHSIFESVLAHKRWAEDSWNLFPYLPFWKPNIVMPASSVHAAFDKACDIIGVEVREARIDPNTGKVDVAHMASLCNRNTIMLVGSAPNYAWGVVDPINEIAELAGQRGIGCHVDACLGSFVVPFARECGANIPQIGFDNPYISAISVDTHKFGCAPKGSSMFLARNNANKEPNKVGVAPHQVHVQLDKAQGLYVTRGLPGSRNGAQILNVWAALMKTGKDKFKQNAANLIKAKNEICTALKDHPDVKIIGNPELFVIGFTSKNPELDFLTVRDFMKQEGWYLNPIQDPRGFHIALTPNLVEDADMVSKFVISMQMAIAKAKQSENKNTSTLAMYNSKCEIPQGVADVVKRDLGRMHEQIKSQVRPLRQQV